MAMMTWLTRTLRSDRGDASPISLVLGSILTLIAALIIGGALTTMLGATSLAQSNSDLTTLMEKEIRQFEQTPFSGLKEEVPHRYKVEVNGRSVSVEREVFYDNEMRAYTLRLTAPRAVLANKPPKVCATLNAEGKTPKGCFSLSSSVVGTPADLGPVLPVGVSVSVRNVDGANKSVNLTNFPDFEAEGAAAAWGATGNGATIETTNKPRLSGTKNLVITKNTVLYSQKLNHLTGETVKSQLWAMVEAGTAQVSVGIEPIGTSPIFGTSVTGKSWTLASQNATFNKRGEYRIAIRVTGCTAGCKVIVDDVNTLRMTENLISDPSRYILENGMTYDAATDSFNTAGQVRHEVLRYNIPAPTMRGVTQLTFGARIAAGATPTGVTGLVRVIYRPSSGADVLLASASLDGIGTASTPLAGVFDFPATDNGQFIISVNQTGGPLKPLSISGVYLLPTQRGNADAVDAPSMEVAALNPAEMKDSIVRVSYQYTGVVPAEDLRVGVFCTTDIGTGSLSTNKVYLSQDTQNRNWYWSRLEVPALDRLTGCTHANIRVWSQSGTVIESSLVKNVSVMKVLDDVTSRNHGKDNGEDEG